MNTIESVCLLKYLPYVSLWILQFEHAGGFFFG